MCTIIAWKGPVTNAAIRHLIGTSNTHGPHATGVGYIGENGRTHVFKRPKHPFTFIKDHADEVEKASESQTGIAHTRLASVGDLTHRNAHPFVHHEVAYCHNGTITNWKDIDHSVSSDSQVLGPLILRDQLSKAHGTLGLTWICDGNLFVYRRRKPVTAATFYRFNRHVTIVATHKFMIPRWFWNYEHTIHHVHESVVYRIDETGPVDVLKLCQKPLTSQTTEPLLRSRSSEYA